MKKVLKGIFGVFILSFLVYVGYRNVNLRRIPNVDLVKDEQTSLLYHRILPNSSNGQWNNYYFSFQKLMADDIPEDIKYNAVYKSINAVDKNIDEEIFKNAYESIFGSNTYKRMLNFIGGCSNYTFNSSLNSYVKMDSLTCPLNSISILSKIVDAKEKGDSFEIVVIIAYIDRTGKIVYRECNNNLTFCSNVLEEGFANFDEADLGKFSNDLLKYKFIFKIVNDNYYFESVEKVR